MLLDHNIFLHIIHAYFPYSLTRSVQFDIRIKSFGRVTAFGRLTEMHI